MHLKLLYTLQIRPEDPTFLARLPAFLLRSSVLHKCTAAWLNICNLGLPHSITIRPVIGMAGLALISERIENVLYGSVAMQGFSAHPPIEVSPPS